MLKAVLRFTWLLRLDRTTRLVILSIALGLVGAGGGGLFLWMLRTAESLLLVPIAGYRTLDVAQTQGMAAAPVLAHPLWWIPVATTLGGLVSGILVFVFAPEAEGHGTDAAVKAYHAMDGLVRARIPLVKSVASAITIGSGGSAGREGPTAQIAAGIGSITATLLGLPEDERRLLVLIGMAAGLAAIFKSPLGAAIFSVEILYSTVAFEGRALMYSIIGAAVAYAVTGIFEGWTPLFYLPSVPILARPIDLVWFLALGVACGAVGAVLPGIFYHMREFFRRLPVPDIAKPAIGGLLLGLIGMFVPQLLGGGYGWMQLAINGKLAIGLMLALAAGKMVAMSLTISSGGSGGVFAPSLYVGTMLGGAMAAVIGAITKAGPDPVSFAVVGMAALFAGAARVPIASLMMAAEMTGGYGLIMGTMLAVAASYLVQVALTRHVTYPTLYQAQVPRPVDSPVHQRSFYHDVARMLRERRMRLDDDIVGLELAERMEHGLTIPLANGTQMLYQADVAAGAPAAGTRLRDLKIPERVLIVSILRGDATLVPDGNTVLAAGDRMIVAAAPDSMQAFRALISAAA